MQTPCDAGTLIASFLRLRHILRNRTGRACNIRGWLAARGKPAGESD